MASEKTASSDASGAAPAAPAAPQAPEGAAPKAPASSAAPAAPPAPTVKPPPVAAPAKGDPDAIAQAVGELADAQEELAQMDKWLDKAKTERVKLEQVRDIKQSALDRLQPIQTNGDAIRAYLDQQKNILKLRGEQKQRVSAFEKENGFKLADLIPKRAPIDTAMARKNSRGAGRPGSGAK